MTTKPEQDRRAEFNAQMDRAHETPLFLGPKRCKQCSITLSGPQSARERVETEPGLCDCCRSMLESLRQPDVKDHFTDAHLQWDAENDRRIGLVRGRA